MSTFVAQHLARVYGAELQIEPGFVSDLLSWRAFVRLPQVRGVVQLCMSQATTSVRSGCMPIGPRLRLTTRSPVLHVGG
jgi:UPF0716 family protein affecting phage T7 exclusion